MRVLAAFIALSMASGFAGCSSDSAGSSDRSSPSMTTSPSNLDSGDSGVEVLVAEPSQMAMKALVHGRLEAVGGCLGIRGSVVVWPYGTIVAGTEPLSIEVPRYGTFVLGDDVEVGGGFVLEHSSDDVGPGSFAVGGITVPARCARHDI